MPRDGKTVAKSFRINQAALEALQEEARKQTISLNTLVNQLLVGYSEAGKYMRQMHALTLTKQTFVEILNVLPEDKMIQTGRAAGKSVPVAIISSKRGKISVNGIIEYLHFMSAYANLFEYSESEENGHWTITLTHELGRKWSLLLAGYFDEAFATVGVKTKYTFTDGSITFNI